MKSHCDETFTTFRTFRGQSRLLLEDHLRDHGYSVALSLLGGQEDTFFIAIQQSGCIYRINGLEWNSLVMEAILGGYLGGKSPGEWFRRRCWWGMAAIVRGVIGG